MTSLIRILVILIALLPECVLAGQESYACQAIDANTSKAFRGATQFKLSVINHKVIELESIQPKDSWTWEIANSDQNGNFDAVRVSKERTSSFPLVGLPAVWNRKEKRFVALNIRFDVPYETTIEKWEFKCL